MRTRILGAAALVAVVSVVAACGGSDDGGGGGEGDELTKEEYIAAADAICEESNAASDALGEPATPEEFVELAPQIIEIGQDQIDGLRALNAPAADDATLEGAYDLIAQQLVLIEELAAAVGAGDEEKQLELVEQGDAIDTEANQIAIDYGLKVCGSS
jgi:hypothetical protein